MYASSRYPGASSSRSTGWAEDRRGFATTADAYDQLRAFIERACSSLQPEPNMSLNLEIADLVNSKKANAPREAVVEVLKNINSRMTHQSMLGLHLLDTLVKNCGYPMHLQIATKDFLNELVRRFPERPPAFPPPPMNKILELIHEWKNTICVSSKYREDLTNIRDMHRLLGYKGYRFRDFDKRAASVLNPSDNLKSPDELEEEDRAAQAAKLQELIRRGTPKDLAAAQELMKVMAGAEPGKKPDYAQQTAKELASIQHRILMLNEMLDNMKPNERFAEGDAFDQISVRCRAIQPKLQKWISSAEEGQDADNIDKLLLMNDLINNVLNRYEAYKKGNRSVSAEINPAFVGKTGKSSTSRKAAPAPNLIDFDEVPPEPATSSAGDGGGFGLEGLSLGGGSSNGEEPSNGNAADLFQSLDFTTAATPGQRSAHQSPAPFYQQYQSQVPAAQAQQAVAWANMGQSASHLPMNSPQGIPSRPAQKGVAGMITLGMANGIPNPSTSRTTTIAPTTAAPKLADPYDFGDFAQAMSQQPTKPTAKKDPFADLLS